MTHAPQQRGRSPARRTARGAVRVLAWAGIAGATIAVLAAAVLLLALPAVEQRPQAVAAWLGEQLGRELRLGSIEIAWRDAAPVILLGDLRIGEPGTPALALAAAEVRIDALASLRAGHLRPAQVTVRGARVQIQRQPDGSLQVAGLGEGHVTGAGAALALVLDALPGAADFALEDATVTLRGFGAARHAQTPVVLTPVSMHLRTEAAGLRLSGALATPAAPASPLRFTVRWPDRNADPLASAEITLSTRELPLAALPAALWPVPLHGRASLDLGGMIANGRIELMRGTLQLDQPALEHAAGTAPVDALQSLVEFARDDDDDWRMTLLRLQTRRGSELSRPLRVVLRREGGAGAARHLLSADHVPLAGVLALLPQLDLPAVISTRLPALLRREGRVEDIEVDLGAELDQPRVRRASMTLRDVRAGDSDTGVTIGPADLRLSFMGTAGQLDLLPAPVGLRPAAGGEPIRLAVGGALRWHLEDGTLVADTSGLNLADGDVRLRLEGSARVPGDGEPIWITGRATGAGLDPVAMKRYLALDWLPLPLSRWLTRAVSAGRLHSFTASLDGAPRSDHELARMLRMQARFEQVDVSYVAGWPALSALNGRLELAQGRLNLEISAGEVSGARIDTASGSIADITVDQPVLELLGHVSGRTEHGAAFLAHTPLAPRFAGLLEQLDAKGQAALDLDLRIGLGSGDTGVRGVIALQDNTVRVPILRSALSKVSGDIAFDASGLGTGTLRAVYLDRPISARMDGTGTQRQRTRLSIEGATDPQGLLRHLYDVGAVDRQDTAALPLLSRLAGQAHWQVLLDIPHRQRIAQEGIGLTVRSDLSGMALDLPAPMGKRAGQARLLSVQTRLAIDGPRTFTVAYGDDARALLQTMPLDGGGHALRRGALRFGAAPAQLPDSEELSVGGEVALLSVDDWVALIAEVAAGTRAGQPQPLAGVGTVDIRAQRLVAMGAGFDDVHLGARRDAAGSWRVRVRGADLDGEIAIPVPVASAPIEADFEHLFVKPASAAPAPRRAATAKLTPRDLPPARLVVKHLRYGDIDLGLARLTLAHGRDGLEVRDLLALSEHLEVRGTGRWTGSGTDTRSAFDLRLHSNDFGSLTQALGYADSGIRGGVADITLQTQWDGSPFDFGLERVQGLLSFRATNGRLLEVQPGATGRMFGLLNITILPRRLLRLDFSDLFEEGMSYERIEGSFRLDAGNAFTDDVRMHTDTARVDLHGRVGLVSEDYDQIMTVTPKLSASLPLVPLWLAEKFLNRKLIDNAFAYRYIITGTWVNPKVERERVEVAPAEMQ
jgi:uncharacterized protein (TIGR02099 family)